MSELDTVGFASESSIQWHMIYEFLSSYNVRLKFSSKTYFNKPRPQLWRGSMINQQHSQYTSKKIEKIYILQINESTSKWCFHFCSICKQSSPFASAHTGVQNAPKILIGRFRKFVINIIFGEKNQKNMYPLVHSV